MALSCGLYPVGWKLAQVVKVRANLLLKIVGQIRFQINLEMFESIISHELSPCAFFLPINHQHGFFFSKQSALTNLVLFLQDTKPG